MAFLILPGQYNLSHDHVIWFKNVCMPINFDVQKGHQDTVLLKIQNGILDNPVINLILRMQIK